MAYIAVRPRDSVGVWDTRETSPTVALVDGLHRDIGVRDTRLSYLLWWRHHVSASFIVRTIIDLPDEQIASLAEVCRLEGLSRTEAVRRAVAAYLDTKQLTERDELFGIWRDRELDGIAYELTLRDEWLCAPSSTPIS